MVEVKIKVSVITTIYNTEKYLERCFDSLAGQTLRELEVIAVNDGSPDNSQPILDRYAAKYPGRFIALHQENAGIGPARNLGLQSARGEYIGFCDSDDWVSEDMYETMYNAAKADNSDVAVCDYMRVYDFDSKRRSRVFPGFCCEKGTPQTVANFVMYSTAAAYVWNKIFKAGLFKETPFIMAGFFDDIASTPILLSNCNKISYIRKAFYNYLRREDSGVERRNDSRNMGLLVAWKRCLDEGNRQYRKEIAYCVYYSICRFMEYKSEHISDFLNFFNENKVHFEENGYIKKSIANGELIDLTQITSPSSYVPPETIRTGLTYTATPYEQSVLDFLNETSELFESLDALPRDLTSELLGMYESVLETVSEYVYGFDITLPAILKERRDRIADAITPASK